MMGLFSLSVLTSVNQLTRPRVIQVSINGSIPTMRSISPVSGAIRAFRPVAEVWHLECSVRSSDGVSIRYSERRRNQGRAGANQASERTLRSDKC